MRSGIKGGYAIAPRDGVCMGNYATFYLLPDVETLHLGVPVDLHNPANGGGNVSSLRFLLAIKDISLQFVWSTKSAALRVAEGSNQAKPNRA